jgi:hypothetical protein
MSLYLFHIDIALSPEVVVERLQSVTRVAPGFFEHLASFVHPSRAPGELFFGRVEQNSFLIHRNIRYRNSFLPIIRGRISASKRGTRVDVLMYMSPIVAAFLAFFLLTASQGAFTYSLTHHTFAPFMLLMFIILLSLGGFFSEALKARKMLASLWLENCPLIAADTIIVVTSALNDMIKCSNCEHLNTMNSNRCLYCGANIVATGKIERAEC